MEEEITELWPSPFIQTHNFSVQYGLSILGQFRGDRLTKISEGIERMAVAGDQLATPVLNDCEGSEAIILQLEDPLGMIEGRRSARERHRLECHAESVSGGIAKGGRTHKACQLIQFVCGIGEREGLLLGNFANGEAEFLEIPAFRAILFRALPGDVPRVKTCRHTFSPPEVAGIQRYVSPPARNTGTFPCTDESR